MSDVGAEDLSEEEFLAEVAAVCAAAPSLTPMGASILLALHFGICGDTRTFARMFGISHALVLREATTLAEEHDLVAILDRNPRTQRSTLALTSASRSLMSRVRPPVAE